MTGTKQSVSVKPLVDRRGEIRLKVSRPVTVQPVGGRSWEACILDVSVRGVRLRSSVAVLPGTQLRVDAPGVLLVGEVTRCDLDDGAYNVGVKLSRPLEMLAELERLNRAFLRDDSE